MEAFAEQGSILVIHFAALKKYQDCLAGQNFIPHLIKVCLKSLPGKCGG